MFTVYILQSKTNNRYYIGSTDNISRRLNEHNAGKTTSTRKRGPWEIVYTEEHPDRASAVSRERQIKSYKHGRAFLMLIRKQYGEVA